jgi:hypothetical protein
VLLLKHKDRALSSVCLSVCLVLYVVIMALYQGTSQRVKVPNAFKVYLAGAWMGKKGPEMNELFVAAGAPEPWSSWVIRAILRSKNLGILCAQLSF